VIPTQQRSAYRCAVALGLGLVGGMSRSVAAELLG